MSLQSRAVLLDLDGTLVDSAPGIIASFRTALGALGHVLPPAQDISALIGPPIADVMRDLLTLFGDDRVDQALAAYRADYGERGLFETALYPGVEETLSDMQQSGARLFLATSKRTVFAHRILEHLKISRLFSGIHGSEPGGSLDQKPELIAHVLRQHGLGHTESVMVGDRRFDIAGAHANGIPALGVLWGYGSRQELELAGADHLIAAMADLPDAIGNVSLDQP